MSDDTTPHLPIDPDADADALEARLAEFRQSPEARGFATLRAELRDAGRGELLAELCATWAPLERDPQRAADAWSEAGEAMVVLGEMATAIDYLRTALDLDPTNDRAVDRLLELVETEDPAAAVEIIEQQLTELAKRTGSAAQKKETITRRAAQHRRAAELWNDHLGRVDRALAHYQQAWKLEPQRTEALDAARQLYISLGDEAMVAKLYQAELDVLPPGSKPELTARRAQIRYQLGKIAQRATDLDTAADHLEEAARLDPNSLEISEALADVYSSPDFREVESPEETKAGATPKNFRHKAGELFVEIGRRRMQTQGDGTAINYLRRAVGVAPGSRPSNAALEQALSEAAQWQELDRNLRHRTNVTQDPHERAEVLRRRAALYRNQLPDRPGLVEVLTEMMSYEPPGSKAALELREILREDQDWEALSRLMEAEVNALGQDPNTPAETIVAELLELATVAREHMGDRDRAAELLHQALGVMPTHEEAVARYVDHFRERRDWRGLIELFEFSLDNAREAGAESDDLVRRLEEIAQLAEIRLGDIPRAIEAWERITELEPASPKVTEALRRLTARAKMWEQLVRQLEAEVAAAGDPVSRMQTLKKMAQTYRERQIEPRRAIELYEQIIADSPPYGGSPAGSAGRGAEPGYDDAVLKALAELYEREGDDAGLANTLRRMLDADEQRVRASMARSGKAADAPAEWPVAKRAERLTMLRRLGQIYETRLADVDGVVFACSAVLELLTGDRDALDRMERVLEKANDARLEQTLEYHAASSTSPAERAKLLKRLAKLATDRGDEFAALGRWESTLRASPADPDALAALSSLYERSGRWGELAQIIERQDGGRPLPAPGTPEAAMRALELERYANILDTHLGDGVRATKAWQRVLELTPRNRTALDALTQLFRTGAKWRELADVLGAQIAVLLSGQAPDDRARAAAAAVERAEIVEQRLGAPADAIKVLDYLIREIDPNHLDAHTSLRRLHEARGDFDAAVRIAEREMYLSPEPARKIARGLEIGMICRDRLANPTRALQAFKRVLELDPDQDEALVAAAELLYKLGRFKDYILMLERMLAIATAREAPGEERRAFVQRIAQTTADRLGDPKGAFRWWRRAHDEAPDESSLAEVRRAGEGYGLWRELGEVLTDERKRLVAIGAGGVPAEPAQYVALSRELAQLAERRLGDKARAMTVLGEALAVSPRDGSLLAELDRLATETDARPAWKVLLDAYEVALASAAPAERVELYLRRAKILDGRMNDARGAVADLLAAFSWSPDREDVRDALVALATKARAWNEVIAVDSALIERAPSTGRRVELLRRKASVIEDQLKDAPRAFRTHLIALLLSPDDADTSSHVWRLARVIGRYREADRTPRAEPASATIQTDQAAAEAHVIAGRAAPGRPTIPRRLQTEPLADDDYSVGDSTQPLDITELEMAEARRAAPPAQPPPRPTAPVTAPRAVDPNAFAAVESTMTLSSNDISQVTTTAATPPRLPSKLPPLRPRPPAIGPGLRPATGQAGRAPPVGPGMRRSAPTSPPPLRKAQATVRRPPLPTLPNRPYESPWEELALSFESLPAPDTASRLRWLYRASEVWETGGKDIARAFDALARAFEQVRRTPGPTGGNDTEVRARLYRIAQEHEAWDRLADLYEGTAEQAETAAAAADLLMEVAQIRQGQGRARDAETQLRRILGMLPNEAVARQRLEDLYRGEGRWVELAASLEERTDPRLGTVAPDAERPQLLRELAGIYTQKLQRPHDAIDAFERLRLLVPADTAVLVQLADLYGAVGRWSKVIETLARVGEIAEGSPEARDALHAIAKIYERELELPDRAIDAYQQVVATWPDDEAAWAQLDPLYQNQARWTELDDVLRRRAALAREPAERAQLLARRAGVLTEWLGAHEDAAAALRHARTIAPDDAALADQLVTALTRAGLDREAASILESRIAAQDESGAKGDLAALFIRLAQLRDGKLNDKAGARTALDRALALVPEHPTALAALAGLASPDEDPRAFADAKLREADSLSDADARIAALMAAGDVLHHRVGDAIAARAAYERVLALRPYQADATWALAGLVEKSGDPEAAARMLEAQLEAGGLPPHERARILTQLAALSRAAGVEPAAERRLLEALAAIPDHVPAIVSLADFYADAARWSDLEAFLRESLDGTLLAAAPTSLVADMHRRLATAHEKLGRDEDAYQTLVAADRLHRGHLMIKLALGENRYKARRWREAALHLSPLAAHDDAARYPTEVAQGLYHAALAEIRSLRPENAPPLYARALELKPSYAPALQALAEIAMEQGDHRRAADLLTRQATGTEDPAERMRLFEALGDMALLMMHDDERALTCYAAAVASAQPIEAKHVALLDKLIERQDLAGDHAGSARTAELRAAFGATPADRAAGHLRAAHDYLAAQDKGRARAAADRAVDSDPYDVEAVDLASELAIEAGDVDAASAMLTRLLSAKDDRLPGGAGRQASVARRATLSYRLGHARAQRGDVRQALPMLDRAIELAPTSEGATSARRVLVELGRDDAARKPAILGHLQAIAHATGALADLVAWADELRKQGRADAGRAALELALACGHAADVHQRAFLSVHKPYAMRDDEPYRAVLDASERELVSPMDADHALLAPIAATLTEAAQLLWSDLDAALARSGGPARRVPATQHTAAVAMVSRLVTALGVGAVMLYQRDDGPDVSIVCAAIPVVVLGPRLASGAATGDEARALVARAVELARPEHLVIAGLPAVEAARLLASVARLYGPPALREAASARGVDRGADEQVRGALPVKLRTRLEQQLAQLPVTALDPARSIAASQRDADRAALLMGGSPAAIVAAATGRGDSVGHLIRALAHPGWLPLRTKLGLGVR